MAYSVGTVKKLSWKKLQIAADEGHGPGGGVPRRRTIWAVGPMLRALSRDCNVSSVSPAGTAVPAAATKQNWRELAGSPEVIGPSFPSGPKVHGSLMMECDSKRHAKSMSASVTIPLGPKLTGLTPGTPPPPWLTGCASQTSALPSPSGRSASIWKSGRALPPETAGGTLSPTAAPLLPGRTSAMIKNPLAGT